VVALGLSLSILGFQKVRTGRLQVVNFRVGVKISAVYLLADVVGVVGDVEDEVEDNAEFIAEFAADFLVREAEVDEGLIGARSVAGLRQDEVGHDFLEVDGHALQELLLARVEAAVDAPLVDHVVLAEQAEGDDVFGRLEGEAVGLARGGDLGGHFADDLVV
jgi:hypothetical protein